MVHDRRRLRLLVRVHQLHGVLVNYESTTSSISSRGVRLASSVTCLSANNNFTDPFTVAMHRQRDVSPRAGSTRHTGPLCRPSPRRRSLRRHGHQPLRDVFTTERHRQLPVRRSWSPGLRAADERVVVVEASAVLPLRQRRGR